MNREIKFRYILQHTVTKLMVSVVYEHFEIFNGLCRTMLSEGLYKDYFIVACCQFTGLLDKNGKEVYEGDVIYIAGLGKYLVELPAIELYQAVSENDIGQIIGNIYENPDLLTDKKD